MTHFEEKHIWIIGASSGIGRALAKTLHERGAVLALSARSEDKLALLNEELGNRHHVYPLDVTDGAQVEKAANSLRDTWPRLDSVIFMAALYQPMSLDDLDMAQAADIVSVNLIGALQVIDAVLPVLKAQQGGQVALCASVAGYRGLPKGQPYGATKAALINLAESLYVEMRPHNIDVKVINPGFVKTPLTDKNDFDMPMMIAPEDAAKAIAKGLRRRAFEIHFPKKFTILMKLLRLLPAPVYFWLATKLAPEKKEGPH